MRRSAAAYSEGAGPCGGGGCGAGVCVCVWL